MKEKVGMNVCERSWVCSALSGSHLEGKAFIFMSMLVNF